MKLNSLSSSNGIFFSHKIYNIINIINLIIKFLFIASLGGGINLVITGSGFAATTTVLICDRLCANQNINSSQITCLVIIYL